jgi:hypothetical protein
MDALLQGLAYVAVAVYGALVFLRRKLSNMEVYVADGFGAAALVGLIMKGKGRFLPMVSLVWLICNYLLQTPVGDKAWFAYDGFTVAAILSRLGY